MKKVLIKLAYRQVIDATSGGDFEKKVWWASYNEFLLKSQAYNPNGTFKTFTQMKEADGRANSLHYKIAFAAGGFVEGLNGRIHGLLDNLDKPVGFDVVQFELLESDTQNIASHRIALNYITHPLTLLNVFGEYMLLAPEDVAENEKVETIVIKLQPGLSIIEYQLKDEEAVY